MGHSVVNSGAVTGDVHRQKYAGPESIALLFPLVFLFILGPNSLPFPFQENRKLVAAFTGVVQFFFLVVARPAHGV
jgi:hypothetical protein